MSGLKEIRRRIVSVKNTKQITRAMKLVSAAKLRRAQESAVNGRLFRLRLETILGEILSAGGKVFDDNVLFKSNPGNQKKLVIMIAGERGLCGPYNSNIVKQLQSNPQISTTRDIFIPLGRRAVSSLKRAGAQIGLAFEGIAEDAGLWPITEIEEFARTLFTSGKVGEVVLIYTRFNSAVNQEVVYEKLLPLVATSDINIKKSPGVVKFDPSLEILAQSVLPLVLKTKLSQAGLESKASEHASRMTAMDSATKNAEDLLDKLKLFYNRARQSTITRELIDIVGGAEAVE